MFTSCDFQPSLLFLPDLFIHIVHSCHHKRRKAKRGLNASICNLALIELLTTLILTTSILTFYEVLTVPDIATDKDVCKDTGRFEVPKEEHSNWLTQAVSDAYDYFVPPENTRPYDIGGLWEIQDDLKAHCGKPIELTPEQSEAAARMAEHISFTGKFGTASDADQAAMEAALKSGHMEDFVRDVNTYLARWGSDFRLDNTDFTERMTYAGDENLAPGSLPIEKNNPRSSLTITDTALGGVSDSQVVASDPSVAGYLEPVPSKRH